jgi:Tripartite tricarboxylate transporter family receptor
VHFHRVQALRLSVAASSTQCHSPICSPALNQLPRGSSCGWGGIGVPANTPVEIIEKLNNEINAGLADPRFIARLADFGGVPLSMASSDFGRLIAEETEKWGKVVKFAGIKPV